MSSARSPAGISLARHLAVSPVIPSVHGPTAVESLLPNLKFGTCILSGLSITELPACLEALRSAGQQAIVNLDSVKGLTRDRDGLAHLEYVGATAVMSSRITVVQFAREHGFIALQWLIVATGTTLAENFAAVTSARPHMVVVVPSPVLSRLTPAETDQLGRFLASGFVRSTDDVRDSISHGAFGVVTSRSELWPLTRADLSEANPADCQRERPQCPSSLP